MTKVCHLTSAHSRYDVRIFEKECVSLEKNSYDVFLIVNDNDFNENKSGVKIFSTGCLPKSRLDRIINSPRHILSIAKSIDADIYHLHDPELLLIALLLKRMGKIVIFDAHEDTSEQIMDKEWIPYVFRKLVSISYNLFSKGVLKRVDGVVTVTPQLVDKFSSFSNTIMVTNYPIIDEFKGFDYLENFNNPEICFAGGISEQWRHKEIITAIEKIDNITYVLAGDSNSTYFEQLKELPGWKKVTYLGNVSHKTVEEVQKKAVAGMAVNFASQIKGKGTLGNTKLFEYMAAGIPVICTNYSLWSEIIDRYKCGITVNPDSISEIEMAIRFIVDNPNFAKIMGLNGRKAVEERFSWASEEKKLVDFYSELLKKMK